MSIVNPATTFRRHVAFGACTLALIALHATVVRDLIALSRRDMTASHLVLIPFVTLGLIAMQRSEIFAAARPAGRHATIAAAAGAMLLWAACRFWASAVPADGLSAAVTALVGLWLALFLVVYGPAAFRAALFPLLFVAFTIPIPHALLAVATLLLKKGSADVVTLLFALVGTPFHRDGFVFALPKFTIEIADQCSGIRSSIALLLTTLLAGHLFLRTGWKRALLVATVIPLAIVKNGIRIVTLSLLGTYVDTGYIDGALHHEGGIVFFLLMLAILFPVLVALQRSEPGTAPEARWA